MPEWMTTKEAAEYLGTFSHRTLREWRKGAKEWNPDNSGPRYFCLHGRIYYDRADLDAWRDSVRSCGRQSDIERV